MVFDFRDRKIRLKREDTKLENLKVPDNIKRELDDEFRSDTQLGTILEAKGVRSQRQLIKKMRDGN